MLCAVKLGLATSPLGPLALINKFNKGVKSTLRLNPLTFDVVKGLFSTSHADLPKPHVIRYSVTSGPGIAVQIWRILAVALLNLPSPGYLVSPPLRSHGNTRTQNKIHNNIFNTYLNTWFDGRYMFRWIFRSKPKNLSADFGLSCLGAWDFGI